MGILPDRFNCGLRMRQECRERFSHHRLQRKPLVNDPGMHHGTCVTHVPWCMLGSLTRGGGENVPGIPGTCANRNFTYLGRGPWWKHSFFCLWNNHRWLSWTYSTSEFWNKWGKSIEFQCKIYRSFANLWKMYCFRSNQIFGNLKTTTTKCVINISLINIQWR